MKLAVLSESPADEAAIFLLVEALFGKPCHLIEFPPPQTRGWMGVLAGVQTTLRYLHYGTDAEALVVVLDSDESTLHQRLQQGGCQCRLCLLRSMIAQCQSQLRSRQGRGPLQTAVGLAVPAIEAWYCVGRGLRISETAWMLGLQSGKRPYSKSDLKRTVYGTERPTLDLETSRAKEEAKRIVSENRLSELEQLFLGGFGALAQDVRKW